MQLACLAHTDFHYLTYIRKVAPVFIVEFIFDKRRLLLDVTRCHHTSLQCCVDCPNTRLQLLLAHSNMSLVKTIRFCHQEVTDQNYSLRPVILRLLSYYKCLSSTLMEDR